MKTYKALTPILDNPLPNGSISDFNLLINIIMIQLMFQVGL